MAYLALFRYASSGQKSLNIILSQLSHLDITAALGVRSVVGLTPWPGPAAVRDGWARLRAAIIITGVGAGVAELILGRVVGTTTTATAGL